MLDTSKHFILLSSLGCEDRFKQSLSNHNLLSLLEENNSFGVDITPMSILRMKDKWQSYINGYNGYFFEFYDKETRKGIIKKLKDFWKYNEEKDEGRICSTFLNGKKDIGYTLTWSKMYSI